MYRTDTITKLSFIAEISLQSSALSNSVEPCDYGVNVFIILAAFRKFLKESLKFREFFLTKMNAVKIHSRAFIISWILEFWAGIRY